jgi:hypothetical protein
VGRVSLKKTPMNPKGGFESHLLTWFLDKTFKGIYGSTTRPPSIDVVYEMARKSRDAYLRLHHEIFGDRYPVCIKSPRMLLVPYFSELRDQFDTKVIILDRDPISQVRSIYKVWRKDPSRAAITNEVYILGLLRAWNRFLRDMKNMYHSLPYLHVDFENLVSKPSETMAEISEFVDVDCPGQKRINEWIDPGLVNRPVNKLI